MQCEVLKPEELAEVVAPCSALVRRGCRHETAGALRFVGERPMPVADAFPTRRPVPPVRRRGEDLLEIVHVDAVRDEPWLPVRRHKLDPVGRLDGHRSARSSRSATAAR